MVTKTPWNTAQWWQKLPEIQHNGDKSSLKYSTMVTKAPWNTAQWWQKLPEIQHNGDKSSLKYSTMVTKAPWNTAQWWQKLPEIQDNGQWKLMPELTNTFPVSEASWHNRQCHLLGQQHNKQQYILKQEERQILNEPHLQYFFTVASLTQSTILEVLNTSYYCDCEWGSSP